ncbi:MAG: mechanosensitive ion channel family protein [Aphanothece sp. CMT-3BRIN-NPC111]|jgi:small-conductance mechanosensitive channel|nr:mechanosensitive ion channel family protein [Aphanothece sp. CMT-3BRIN-NPC111]
MLIHPLPSKITVAAINKDIIQIYLPQPAVFLLFIVLSVLLGGYTPSIVTLIIRRFSSPEQVTDIYENLIKPIKPLFKIAGTFLLISISITWLEEYKFLYKLVKPTIDLGVIISVAWLLSRLSRQFLRVYGVDLLGKLGREFDDLILVIETLVNVVIGFIALLAFAQSQQFNLVGLMASLGIGGLAVAFAAQKILEQLLSTIVLYLDRPFVPGDYIRIPSVSNIPGGLFGRVESIGLRSTKIRTAAKNTLYIVPNSTLANLEIENVTMGKKVMVLLYLDFARLLEDRERALVQQIINESTDSVFGIDPGSTNITLTDSSEKPTTRARVTFFILGSTESSIKLRKQLLELANEKISKQLMTYGINFTMQEPTIYVESPIAM